jgi:hypothetical protein
MFLCISKDNNYMNNFITSLNDDERWVMNEMMGICFAQLLNLQPCDDWRKRRLIPELPLNSESIQYATEDVVLSHLVDTIKTDMNAIFLPLKERIFIQWFLDELISAYTKRHNDEPTIMDLFNEIFKRAGAMPPPPPLDRELTLEDFCLGARILCPVVTESEAERVFIIVDTDGGGSLSEEEFQIVFTGMAGEAGCISEAAKANKKSLWTKAKNTAMKAMEFKEKAKERLSGRRGRSGSSEALRIEIEEEEKPKSNFYIPCVRLLPSFMSSLKPTRVQNGRCEVSG